MAPDDTVELFAVFGPVSVRRMFGGSGIFADGLCIAIVHDGVIYLKADARNAPDFERENLAPFTYMRGGGAASLTSYRRMPNRLYDDPDELAPWAASALDAARRSASGRRAPAKRRKSCPTRRAG